ncbi:MAG: hypothetical protein QNJ57_13415 [Flavobacteriaceae bacterium]|nr:hypothetical protein [Flavobacteriaceae bacterium]
MKKNAFLLCLALLSLSCSKTQPSQGPIFDKVLPGDKTINPDVIKPHKISYDKPGGSMVYNMKEVDYNGESVYLIEVYMGDESVTPDKMYFDKNTLGYKGRRLEMQDYIVDVAFKDGKFIGDIQPTEGSDFKPMTYDKAYDHNAFEPAVLNYFIASLPLKKGYKASIPTFDLNSGSSIIWANIEVLDEEKVKLNGKTYDTWKVKSHGIKEKTIWISKEHPYAVKFKTKGAGIGTWKLNKVF